MNTFTNTSGAAYCIEIISCPKCVTMHVRAAMNGGHEKGNKNRCKVALTPHKERVGFKNVNTNTPYKCMYFELPGKAGQI